VKKSGFGPDLIVGIGRGGWVPARLMSDMLGIDQILAMRIEFYNKPGKSPGVPVVTQGVSRPAIIGRKILVVDDVSDTGESLEIAKGELAAAKEVRIATLHYKPHSKLKPDYYTRQTSAWIEYPWEKRETARALGR